MHTVWLIANLLCVAANAAVYASGGSWLCVVAIGICSFAAGTSFAFAIVRATH